MKMTSNAKMFHKSNLQSPVIKGEILPGVDYGTPHSDDKVRYQLQDGFTFTLSRGEVESLPNPPIWYGEGVHA